MNSRVCRFHLTSDATAIVEHHPQAKTTHAKQSGTIILRIESWVGAEARQRVVDAMNTAQITADELSGRKRDT